MGELADFAIEHGMAALIDPGSYFFRSAARITNPYEGRWKFVRECPRRGEPAWRYTLTIETRDFEVGISQKALTDLFASQVYFPPESCEGNGSSRSLCSNAELLDEYFKRHSNITPEEKQQLKADCKTISALVTDFFFTDGGEGNKPDMRAFGDSGELTKAEYELQKANKERSKAKCQIKELVDNDVALGTSTSGLQDSDWSKVTEECQTTEVGDNDTALGKPTSGLQASDESKISAGSPQEKKYSRSTKWIVFGGPGFYFPNLRLFKIFFIPLKKLVLSASNAPKLEWLRIEQVNFLEQCRFSLPSLRVLHLEHVWKFIARDIANSISACPLLKKLILVKNYGMSQMPPMYMPSLETVDCYRGDDLDRFVLYAPRLSDAAISLDRKSVDEFKVAGEFKRFWKVEHFVQSFFLENKNLAEKVRFFQDEHGDNGSRGEFRVIVNRLTDPQRAMRIFDQGQTIWSTQYVDAFAATENEVFYEYHETVANEALDGGGFYDRYPRCPWYSSSSSGDIDPPSEGGDDEKVTGAVPSKRQKTQR